MRSRKIYMVHMNRKGAPDFSTALPVETKRIRYYDEDEKAWTVGDVIAEDGEYVCDIVRCKDCKHNYNKALNHGKMKPRCDFTDRVLNENDFCSRGEREGE